MHRNALSGSADSVAKKSHTRRRSTRDVIETNLLRPDAPRPRAELAAQSRANPVDPVAERRTGGARIDQVVHAEGLGACERIAACGQLFLELAAARLGIGRCLDLAPERDRDPAFDRKRTA